MTRRKYSAQEALARARRDGTDALAPFEEARSAAFRDGDVSARAAAALGVGETLLVCDRYRPASEAFMAAAEDAQTVGDSHIEAAAYRGLADTSIGVDEYGTAARLLDYAISTAASTSDPRLMAHARRSQGDILRLEGHYDEAQQAYQEALDLVVGSDDLAEAELNYVLGLIRIYHADFQRGERYIRRARRHARRAGDRAVESSCLGRLARIDRFYGKWDMARLKYERGGEIARSIGSPRRELGCVRGVGHLAAREGDLRTAREKYAATVVTARDIGDRQNLVLSLRSLAKVDADAGDFDAARVGYEEALQIARDVLHNRHAEAHALQGLGHVALLSGDYQTAERYCGESVAMYESLRDPLGFANSHHSLAEARRRSGDRRAVSDLRTTVNLYVQLGDRAGEARARADLSRALVASGDEQQALAEGLLAVRMIERLRRRFGTGESRFRFYRHHRRTYLHTLALAAAQADGDVALEVAEAARSDALAALLRRGAVDLPGEVGVLLRQIVRLEQQFAEQDPTQAREEREDDTTRARNAVLDRRLGEAYERLATVTSTAFLSVYDPKPTNVEALRAALAPDSHALLYEIDVADDGASAVCYVVWLSPGGTTVSCSRLDGEALGLIRGFGVSAPAAIKDARAGRFARLGELLLPPDFDRALARHADPVVLVVPAGGLWAVPFSALHVPGSGRALVERCRISYLPSLGLYAALRAHTLGTPGSGALTFFNRRLAPAAIDRERNALAEAFTPVTECEPHEIAAAIAGGDTYALVVIAAHGDANAGLAHGLDLGEGRTVRAGEFLLARFPQLLVLGACSSGRLDLEPGREPLGLPTVALARGARVVLAALFDVDDLASGEILADAYRRIGRGSDPAEALRTAQIAHRAHCGKKCPPEHWAGLVAIGYLAATPLDEPAPGNGRQGVMVAGQPKKDLA